MNRKMKLFLPVAAAFMALSLAGSAFAQESCSVASTPVSRDTATGLTEVAGDVIFNCTYGGTATLPATITITYPGATITDSAVTSATVWPLVNPIRIANSTMAALPTIATVNNTTPSGGSIVVNVPAQTASGNFTVTGVLLALPGVAAPLSANVSVSPGDGVNIVAGQNNTAVITSILPGLGTPSITKNTVAGSVLASNIPIQQTFSVDIPENYQDMFRSSAQFNAGNAGSTSNGTQVLLTFSGIPTGVTLGTCSAVTYDVTTTTVEGAAFNPVLTFSSGGASLTSTNNTVVVDWSVANPPSLNDVEAIRFTCTTFTAGASASIPLASGSITVTASLAPAGSALNSSGAVLATGTTGQIPRYVSTPTAPLTVLNIIPATTTMLVPYAVVNSTFDTGIALANTTSDPFGSKYGAVQTGGTVSLSFYPQTGSSCTLTTATGGATSFSSVPGVGLDATGNLNTGRTWTVLLSQLLGSAPSAAGCPSASGFTGYIFIVANSTEVHGSAFVTNSFAAVPGTFTSYSNVLVLPTPSGITNYGGGNTVSNARNGLTFESLNN